MTVRDDAIKAQTNSPQRRESAKEDAHRGLRHNQKKIHHGDTEGTEKKRQGRSIGQELRF